jgi:hypothetical protein
MVPGTTATPAAAPPKVGTGEDRGLRSLDIDLEEMNFLRSLLRQYICEGSDIHLPLCGFQASGERIRGYAGADGGEPMIPKIEQRRGAGGRAKRDLQRHVAWTICAHASGVEGIRFDVWHSIGRCAAPFFLDARVHRAAGLA